MSAAVFWRFSAPVGNAREFIWSTNAANVIDEKQPINLVDTSGHATEHADSHRMVQQL